MQLLDGGSAKCVAGGQHQAVLLFEEAVRKLADGGGLANAVHTHHQHHEGRMGADIQRFLDSLQQVHQLRTQRPEQRVGIGKFPLRHTLA